MHALWSRAVQAPSSCRCGTCLPLASTLIRRTTTAAPRRKLTAADIFTACYTTILGTAAVLDARRKDSKRKELDHRLDQARASLSSLAVTENPTLGQDPGDASPWPRPDSQQAGTAPSNHRGCGECEENKSIEKHIRELNDVAALHFRRAPRRSWLQQQIDLVAVEAAIASEEQDGSIPLRHPYSPAKMQMTAMTIESLVQELLWRCEHAATQNAPNPSRDAKSARLLEEVENLRRSPHYPSYELPHFDPEATKARGDLLSASFRRIFNKAMDAREVVGKICYNLLLTNSAPNVHHYNTLIAGFNRIGRQDLAQAVVNSYLDDTPWPATQQTMVCLLNHARASNDLDQFREIIARMRGVHEDGLHIRIFRRSAIYDKRGEQYVQRYCAGRKHAWVERAPRGDEVYDSLVRGWLHFGNLTAACMAFVACIRNGHFVTADTIYQVIAACLSTLDQKSARALLKGLVKKPEHFRPLLKHAEASSSTQMALKIASMFRLLFDLCGVPYAKALQRVRHLYEDISQTLELLHNLTTRGGLELDDVKKSTVDLAQLLDSPNPPSRPAVMALHQLRVKQNGGHRDMDTMLEFKSLARVASLHRLCQALYHKTKRIDAHAKVLVLNSLTGVDWDPNSELPPIDWQNRGRVEPYPPVFYKLSRLRWEDLLLDTRNLRNSLLHLFPARSEAAQLQSKEFLLEGKALRIRRPRFDANAYRERADGWEPPESPDDKEPAGDHTPEPATGLGSSVANSNTQLDLPFEDGYPQERAMAMA